MNKCDKCGANNARNAKYCCECGYELPKPTIEEIQNPNSEPTPKRDYKKLLGIIVGVITCFIIQQLFFKAPSFDKAMMDVASELNKSCPIMVDSETRLDNTVALPNNAFQYNYTLINLDKSEVIIDTVKKYLEPGIINNVKTNPDLKIYRDNKTTMIYYYKDKNGEFVYKLSVTPDMYK